MSLPNSHYITCPRKKPVPLGMCDRSGFLVRHTDMVWQMEYTGSGLVKTGSLVHKDFVDKPNPQKLSPLLWADPVPISYPRPDPNVKYFGYKANIQPFNPNFNPIYPYTPPIP